MSSDSDSDSSDSDGSYSDSEEEEEDTPQPQQELKPKEILDKIEKLELQGKQIKQENKIMKFKNIQLEKENMLIRLEKIFLKKCPRSMNKSEKKEMFSDFFEIHLDYEDSIYPESKALAKVIDRNGDFMKLSANDKYLILITPHKELEEVLPGSKNCLQRLPEIVFFDKIIGFLNHREVFQLRSLNKRVQTRVESLWQFTFFDRLKRSLILGKFSSTIRTNEKMRREIMPFVTKLQKYCEVFIHKLNLEVLEKLASDDQVGSDIQKFFICLLKFVFGDLLLIQNINDYTFLDWNAYFHLVKLLFKCKDSEQFEINEHLESREILSVILQKAYLEGEINLPVTLLGNIRAPASKISKAHFEMFCKKFLPCIEFTINYTGKNTLEISQILFLRTFVKQLQVLEDVRHNHNLLQDIQKMCQIKLEQTFYKQGQSDFFRKSIAKIVKKQVCLAEECNDASVLQKNMRDTVSHFSVILEHLKQNSLKDIFLMDVFLNFPRDILEEKVTRKSILDGSLSMLSAVHSVKKFTGTVEFELYYELIHSKIFEMIKSNTHEIHKNAKLKEENAQKIKDIETKIKANKLKIQCRSILGILLLRESLADIIIVAMFIFDLYKLHIMRGSI